MPMAWKSETHMPRIGVPHTRNTLDPLTCEIKCVKYYINKVWKSKTATHRQGNLRLRSLRHQRPDFWKT